MWIEALNLAGVDASLGLRKIKNIFYPPALRVVAQPISQPTTAPQARPTTKPFDVDATGITLEPTKEKETEHSNPPPAANTDPPSSVNI